MLIYIHIIKDVQQLLLLYRRSLSIVSTVYYKTDVQFNNSHLAS